MKIAFPLLNEKELAVDFAHSYYIGIYDDAKCTIEMIAISDVRRNEGISLFFDEDTTGDLQYVASPRFSYMTLRVFREKEITALKAISHNLEENIQYFKSNSLKPFNVYESLMVG